MKNKDKPKKVVITTGDPAGCGPFITLKAIEALAAPKNDFFIVGDKKVLEKIPVFSKVKNRINLIDVNTPGIGKIKSGRVSELCGCASLNYLKRGLELTKELDIKRIVTAPVSKEAVKYVLPDFSGHTEYLAGYFGVKNYVMMMASRKLKVVLFSRHIPLREVSHYLNAVELINTFSLTYFSLKKMFKINEPKIAVASCNPHAGMNTFLDKEEEIIYKAVKKFKKIDGPYPSDTLFTKDNLKKYDCVVCMYHDQAMIPFKLLSFLNGVNITLGLPIIRTSPAHGTAYDIMKRGISPFFSSMVEAVKLALMLQG